MSFFVESKGGSFERCPSGMHLARCYRVIDLGTQKSEYMGQVKHSHKVMLGWEIHGTDEEGNPVRMADNRPFSIFKNYTLSWSEKANLRLDLQSWRGKPFTQEEMRRFDLKNILGAWCMLNVIDRQGKDGNMYANVSGITPVPAVIKGAGLPPAVNKNELFNIEDPDLDLFNAFSDNLKRKIEASPEWQKKFAKTALVTPSQDKSLRDAEDSLDEVPF